MGRARYRRASLSRVSSCPRSARGYRCTATRPTGAGRLPADRRVGKELLELVEEQDELAARRCLPALELQPECVVEAQAVQKIGGRIGGDGAQQALEGFLRTNGMFFIVVRKAHLNGVKAKGRGCRSSSSLGMMPALRSEDLP
ncbi:MAG: hypothetical protein H6574_18470 [Lewinellaceae bacterium]|nr:hypothetical protein [Lewinellaceae bacterium]